MAGSSTVFVAPRIASSLGFMMLITLLSGGFIAIGGE
jgi:hypothetical protein